MKEKRHRKILEIIRSADVYTQEELMSVLDRYGFKVTQATVSRDIRELKLVKIINSEGLYHYSLPESEDDSGKSKLKGIFESSVKSIDCAGNIAVIKCHTGMAQAVCASLDAMKYEQVVGTIAGDDTVFILLRTEKNAVQFAETLKTLIFGRR
jgi:transcriptional regulator of arginine metabolism